MKAILLRDSVPVCWGGWHGGRAFGYEGFSTMTKSAPINNLGIERTVLVPGELT